MSTYKAITKISIEIESEDIFSPQQFSKWWADYFLRTLKGTDKNKINMIHVVTEAEPTPKPKPVTIVQHWNGEEWTTK